MITLKRDGCEAARTSLMLRQEGGAEEDPKEDPGCEGIPGTKEALLGLTTKMARLEGRVAELENKARSRKSETDDDSSGPGTAPHSPLLPTECTYETRYPGTIDATKLDVTNVMLDGSRCGWHVPKGALPKKFQISGKIGWL